jgi:alginate O-acetyltransferase complex protein AlgI
MLFCTRQFAAFFVIVFAVYWLLPWRRARVWFLVLASVLFYASWSRPLAALVVGFTLLDYLLGLAIQASTAPRQRRGLLVLGLALNLGLLGYFKYADFFLRSLEQALHAAGAAASLPMLRLLVPVGLSFYTFEAINYLVDVYRGRLAAEREPGHFLLFILFFPHLVAGPIVQPGHFLPQTHRPKRFSWMRLHLGLRLVLLGVIKKLLIADRMALIADPVFSDPSGYSTGSLWLATLAYALQVYGDFSGYSDIALGCAHMLGYKLALNFNMPYLSANIADFWRRWHISLSTWLRNHLYIPLGGSRGGCWKTARNLLVTMTLGGLWHGANWTYVVWGMLHGLMLLGHRGFVNFCRGRQRLTNWLLSGPGTVLRISFTLLCFCLTLVVFRCSTLLTGSLMLSRMLRLYPVSGIRLHGRGLGVTVAVVALGHAVALRPELGNWARRLPAPVRGLAYASALTMVLVLMPGISKAFIYFQF